MMLPIAPDKPAPPRLTDVRHVYEQEADCCGPDLNQGIVIETADGGGGAYLVIQTERWAIEADDIDAFAAMLRGVMDSVTPTRRDAAGERYE